MADDLQLYIPNQEDGWFYIQMMSDPETMAYAADARSSRWMYAGTRIRVAESSEKLDWERAAAVLCIPAKTKRRRIRGRRQLS